MSSKRHALIALFLIIASLLASCDDGPPITLDTPVNEAVEIVVEEVEAVVEDVQAEVEEVKAEVEKETRKINLPRWGDSLKIAESVEKASCISSGKYWHPQNKTCH